MSMTSRLAQALALLPLCAGLGCSGSAQLDTSLSGLDTASGLKAEYFSDEHLGQLALTRVDATVNFNWSTASPGHGVPFQYFSVRWTGSVIPRFTETYTFHTLSDDGVRVWVNGQPLIDNWTLHRASADQGTIELEAGHAYAIQVDYFQQQGGAVIQLGWSSPSQAFEVIPADRLRSAAPATQDAGVSDAGLPSPDGGTTTGAGAGKSGYTCPAGGVQVGPAANLAAAVSALPVGGTLCISGRHRITSPLTPKSNQTWVGVTTDAAISGGQVINGWTPVTIGGTTLWVYAGPAAQISAHTRLHYAGAQVKYQESIYQDDLFYRGPTDADSARMFRVLSLTDLMSSGPTADGLSPAGVEKGRFFFDYHDQKIFINQDPTNAIVELAASPGLINGGGAVNFTLQNVLLEEARDTGLSGGRQTQLTDVTIRYVHNIGLNMPAGTDASHRTVVTRALLTQNGQYGINSVGSWILLKDTEISWNNIVSYRNPGGGYYAAGGTKFVYSNGTAADPGLWLDGVNSHDNIGDGFWTDVHNQYVLVENSEFHHNERNGYFHEISCAVEFRNNVFHDNGRAIMNVDLARQGYGVEVSTSNNANVHDNLMYGNTAGAVQLVMDWTHNNLTGIQCATISGDTDTSHLLMNNQVHDNTLYSCAQGGVGLFQNSGNPPQTEMITARHNSFTANTYRVPDTNQSYWRDVSLRTWSSWHTSIDPTGTAVPGCTYP